MFTEVTEWVPMGIQIKEWVFIFVNLVSKEK